MLVYYIIFDDEAGRRRRSLQWFIALVKKNQNERKTRVLLVVNYNKDPSTHTHSHATHVKYGPLLIPIYMYILYIPPITCAVTRALYAHTRRNSRGNRTVHNIIGSLGPYKYIIYFTRCCRYTTTRFSTDVAI